MDKRLALIYDAAFALWRYRWRALATAWVVCVVGWLFVYSMPDIYESHARIYVDTKTLLRPLLRGLSVETNISDTIGLVNKALLSRPSLEAVARETDLDVFADTPAEHEDMLDSLKRRITIKSERGADNLYLISYTDKSAERAYKVVKILLDSFVERVLGSDRHDSSLAQSFLQEQIAQYEARLKEAETRLADFKRKNVGLLPGERGGYYDRLHAALIKEADLKEKLRLAQLRRDEIRRQLSGEKRLIGTATANGGGVLSPLNSLLAQLAELKTRYTENHPRVQELERKIAGLKDHLRHEKPVPDTDGEDRFVEINDVYQQLKIRLSEAQVDVIAVQQALKETEKEIASLKDMVDTIPQIEAELTQMNRDYDVTKEQYLTLVQRMEIAKLSRQAQQKSDDVKFDIIEPPVVPVRPIAPNRAVFLAAVTIFGIGAGVASAYLWFVLRPVYYLPDRLREDTELPLFGAISIEEQGGNRFRNALGTCCFALLIAVLLGSFVSAVVFREEGTSYVQLALADLSDGWSSQ